MKIIIYVHIHTGWGKCALIISQRGVKKILNNLNFSISILYM